MESLAQAVHYPANTTGKVPTRRLDEFADSTVIVATMDELSSLKEVGKRSVFLVRVLLTIGLDSAFTLGWALVQWGLNVIIWEWLKPHGFDAWVIWIVIIMGTAAGLIALGLYMVVDIISLYRQAKQQLAQQDNSSGNGLQPSPNPD